jgi:hypothetical protein
VYKALKAWLSGQLGAEMLRASRAMFLIDDPSPPARAEASFAAILRELVRSEHIRALPRRADEPIPEVVLLRDGRCNVHWEAVAEIVAKCSGMPIDWSAFGRALAAANVIMRCGTKVPSGYRRVWTTRPGWWQENVTDFLQAHSKKRRWSEAGPARADKRSAAAVF